MLIHEAVSMALEKGDSIFRESWAQGSPVLKPTNGNSSVEAISQDGRNAPKWQPKAEDLLANDWAVLPNEFSPSKCPCPKNHTCMRIGRGLSEHTAREFERNNVRNKISLVLSLFNLVFMIILLISLNWK